MSHWPSFVTQLLSHLPFSGDLPDLWREQLSEALQEGLSHYAVVTREEFETQTSILARTQAKLELLEEKLCALESDQ